MATTTRARAIYTSPKLTCLDTMSPNSTQESCSITGTLFACALELVAALEKTTELNLQAARTWLYDQQTLLSAMISTLSAAELIDFQSQRIQVIPPKVFAYWHRAEEITVETCIGLLGTVHDWLRASQGAAPNSFRPSLRLDLGPASCEVPFDSSIQRSRTQRSRTGRQS